MEPDRNVKQRAIIVDIDGTLSNADHRKHYIEGDKKDWKGFLSPEELRKDTVNKWCADLVKLVWQDTEADICVILLTGRMGRSEVTSVTKDWLRDNHIDYDILLMRPDQDYRSDTIVKKEIFEQQIKDKYDVLFAVDDRKSVAGMWRSIGVVCLHCAEGDF